MFWPPEFTAAMIAFTPYFFMALWMMSSTAGICCWGARPGFAGEGVGVAAEQMTNDRWQMTNERTTKRMGDGRYFGRITISRQVAKERHTNRTENVVSHT